MLLRNGITSAAFRGAVAAFLWTLAVVPVHGELLVEEEFDYELLSLIDGQNGGLGFDGPWSASKSHGRDYVMQFEGLTFMDENQVELPVAGNSLSRYGSMGRAEAHRKISAKAQAALTQDNTTVWFAVLVAAPSAHRWGSFHFGNYKYSTQGTPLLGDGDDDRHGNYTPYDGEGFGFTFMTPDYGAGDGTINALAFDDSSIPVVSAGTFTQPIQPGARHHDPTLVVGKINWKPAGTPDELFLFNVTDLTTEPEEDEAIASITDVDLDQSTFNLICVWDTNNTIFDEIRFGTTFFDVVGRGVCPSIVRASGGPDGVTLSWQNGLATPTSVRIVRNGVELAAAAPADPPQYVDKTAEPGLLTYELSFVVPGEDCGTIEKQFNACITDLQAERLEDGVRLTWQNNLGYEAIRILRDDGTGEVVLEASYPGDAQEYLDEDIPDFGELTYSVAPTNGDCDPISVVVNLNCEIPAPICDRIDDGARLEIAFAFGVHPGTALEGQEEWCETPNEPGTPYVAIEQTSPDAIAYSEDVGWGFEVLFPDPLDQPFGARGGYGIFGPFDNTANDRNVFSTDCSEELYNSFIGAKDFTKTCNAAVTGGDPGEPCSVFDPENFPPEGIIFRVDVPNGKYRFVAAVGSPDNRHAHRLLAENGGSGMPGDIKNNYVTLIYNHDQAQFSKGEVAPGSGQGVYARVGFNGRIPPLGDGIPPDPQFVNMDENGRPTADCPNSPTLEVTEGYIRFHVLQANSNDGCGGTRDANGGDLCILEIWRVDVGPGPEDTFKRGDVNADGGLNIADAIALLGHLFGGEPAPSCPDAADSNDDGGLNIADAIAILGHLFAGEGDLPAPFGKCGPDPTADDLPPCKFPPCAQ